MKHSTFFSDYKNLIISPYQNGIQVKHINENVCLNQPSKSNSILFLKNLFDFPLLIYFYDTQNIFELVNETTASINGFISAKETIGKNMTLVTSKDFTNILNANNNLALSEKSTLFFEEEILRNDGYHIHGLSIKCPWYLDNKLMGVFGMSFAMNHLAKIDAESLSVIAKTGLIEMIGKSNSYPHFISKKHICGVYLTPQQMNVIGHIIRGNTAKAIAKKLNISSRTVEMHLKNIKIKLDVRSKSELIEKVIDYLIKKE